MFQRTATIIFAILGIATILGFISGVAPGFFIKSYALLGTVAGLFLFLFILLIVTALLFEYQNKNQVFSTRPIQTRIFNKSLSNTDKILLIFINFIIFTGGILLGVLCELFLKAIIVSTAVHIIIAAIFSLAVLVLLVIILIVGWRDSKESKINHSEEYPLVVEPNTRLQVVTKPQDGPKNTAARINRYRSRYVDEDSSFNSFIAPSTNTSRVSKPPSNIQTEYQKLLRPSPRFHLYEKVFINDSDDIAQIIEADGMGGYKIQYLADGSVDFKNGAELRKALPLIT